MPPEEKNEETPTTETPAETTETPSSETPHKENEISFEEPDFSKLTDFVEKDGEEETPPVDQVAEEPEVPSEETPAEEAAEPEKKEEKSESEEEAKAKVEAEKKAETPKEEPPPAKPEFKMPTEEELTGMYKEHREKTLPKFEEMLQLTEEEAAALDEQPSKVLPKLAAQLMYDTMLSTYNAVLAALPSPVNRLIEASGEAKKAESEFFSSWPELEGKDKAPVVAAAIQAYRSANPRADRATVMKQVGIMAMLQLGLDPVNRKKADAKPSTPKPTPPKPAGGRNTAQMTPPKKPAEGSENIFGELAEAFRDELS